MSHTLNAVKSLLIFPLLLSAVAQGQGPQFEAFPGKTVSQPRTTHTQKILAMDADGNGTQDLVLLDSNPNGSIGNQARIFFNDGNGKFLEGGATRIPWGYGGSNGAVGDMDGDGDTDLLVGEYNVGLMFTSGVFLMQNDGKGNFSVSKNSPIHLPGGADYMASFATGDIDGDGDLDVVVQDARRWRTAQTKIYFNDGRGLFAAAPSNRMPKNAIYHSPIYLLDVDLDKDLDIVIGDYLQARLYLNNGKGYFTEATSKRMPKYPRTSGWTGDRALTIAPLDADGDGDPDLLISTVLGRNLLYLNTRGTFQDVSATHLPKHPALKTTTNGITVGDVDMDGDLDLYFSDIGSSTGKMIASQNRLYLNNGNGFFVDATKSRLPRLVDVSTDALLVDLDQDGDADLVYGGTKDQLLFNLHRQAHAKSAPQRGSTWTMDYYATPGYATQAQRVFPYLSAGLLPKKIAISPFGMFGLSPVTLLALPNLRIPRAGGRVSVGLPIPNLPGLKGVQVHIQGLWLHGRTVGTWRFGNVVSATIR